MARRVKFALELKDGFQARNNIDEIREHFDYGKMVEHFLNDSKLERWLEDRHYEAEAIALSALSINAPDFPEKFCYIFHVDSKTIDKDSYQAKDFSKSKKLDLVKQYTDNEEILAKIDCIATTPEELAELIANKTNEIYLCGKEFSISPDDENVTYVGIGNVIINVNTESNVDFSKRNIEFKNIALSETYVKLCEKQDTAKEKIVTSKDSAVENKITATKGEALWNEANKYKETNPEQYIKLLKEASEHGNSKAMYDAGYYYETKRKFVDMAEYWYEAAIQAGNTEAAVQLGNIYQSKGKPEAAVKYYKSASEKGSARGSFYYAMCYENGYGVEVDVDKAVNLYNQAYKAGYEDAKERLITIEMGDFEAAIIKADKENEILSKINKLKEKDSEEYLHFLKETASDGDTDAMFEAGIYYEKIRNFTDMAEYWYETAMKQGHSTAAVRLGNIYIKRKRFKEAARCYKEAAEKENPWGTYFLALCYVGGIGVEKNRNKAMELYDRAYHAGNVEA